MGDMADFALEEMMDVDELQQRFAAGDYSHDEADALGLLDEFGHPFPFVFNREPSPPSKTCRCCKQGGLMWCQHQGKWRLFKGDKLHQCPANPLRH